MKKSSQDIANFITDTGVQLLTPTETITSIHDKLELQCRCGDIYHQSYRDFRQQRKFQCLKCTQHQNAKRRRNTIEDVAELLYSRDCILRSDYVNAHSKIKIECRCGEIYEQSLSDFRSIMRSGRPNMCPQCAKSRKISQQTLTYTEVKNFVHSTGCELMTKQYTSYNNVLSIRCRHCKKVFTNTLKDFKNNGTYACSDCTRNNISVKEKQVIEFVQSLTSDVIVENDRNILDGKEIDILIPAQNIAIEYNGVYFHSEKFGRGRSYHLQKTLGCQSKNIRLFHIFENEWNNQTTRNVWKSILTANLKKSPTRIYARQCTVEKISFKDAQDFLSKNHLQGGDKSSIRYGLQYGNELVAVMTFSTSRFSKKHDYELLRMASKTYTTVVGGASKLFAAFSKDYPTVSVVTYADLRYSVGAVYHHLGFNLTHVSPPSYHYVKQNRLYNRINFQKHKLKSKLEIYDNDLSEKQNMERNGYFRIWDCGNYVFSTITTTSCSK